MASRCPSTSICRPGPPRRGHSVALLIGYPGCRAGNFRNWIRSTPVAKLELLTQDAPYGRPSNLPFAVSVSRLSLRLPLG